LKGEEELKIFYYYQPGKIAVIALKSFLEKLVVQLKKF